MSFSRLSLLLAVVCCFRCTHARSLFSLFVPQAPTACSDYVQSSCTLVQAAEQRTDSCSQSNAAQMASSVTDTDRSQGVDLAFYGDSITKLWKDGSPGSNGMSDVFSSYFGRYSAAVLGIGGDQVGNLLWRLQHGEVFQRHPPKIAIVLIGTNDLGAAACGVGESGVDAAANGVVSRIQNTTSYLLQMNPSTQIIVMAILPRADGESVQAGMYQWPNKYTNGIAKVNAGLEALVSGNVHVLDCTKQLLPDGQVYQTVLTDGLHPSSEGLTRLAQCLSPLVSSLL